MAAPVSAEEPAAPSPAPAPIRTQPVDGLLFGKGQPFDPAVQFATQGVATPTASADPEDAIRLVFPPAAPGATAVLKPAAGRWDLSAFLEVHVRVRNAGLAAVAPRLSLLSDGGASDVVSAPTLASGVTAEIVVPFASATPWRGRASAQCPPGGILPGQPGTGSDVTSDAVSGVALSVSGDGGASAQAPILVVESVRAVVPPPPVLPTWLGQRPPVGGEWVKTFDDGFDGTAIDAAKWSNTGPNYYDKLSHWSAANTVVGGGFAALRYEKKEGFQNDDPKGKQTPYASGFLESLGKWTQRYGYFEARLKLPRAPGLWPAFWMMPDRGAASADRGDTGNGGMELDVMEHLTRWGPYRYNIAMHWDGYEKDHKQTGSGKIYVQPDADGFLTTGVLWLPGKLVYYCNGREVLRWDDPRVPSVPADMMFTLPTGGWDNNPLEDVKLPADFVVDYVRAWQRKDLILPPVP